MKVLMCCSDPQLKAGGLRAKTLAGRGKGIWESPQHWAIFAIFQYK